MEIDTAFMLFCLYVCRTEIKIILLLFNGEKTWCKATCTAVFHCPFLQVYLARHTHIAKTGLNTQTYKQNNIKAVSISIGF
jgi:hypothetical protein